MPIHKSLLSKKPSIEDSIFAIQQKLLNAGFNIVEQNYQNPISNIWTIRINDFDCPLLFSNGKGTSKNAALASALSEFSEHLVTHFFWLDCYLGDEIANNKFVHYPKERWFKRNSDFTWPEGILNSTFQCEIGESLRELYNPNGELNTSSLIDTNSANIDRGICCLPYQCVRTGDIVNFPINIIDTLYANNGIAFGNTVEEAHLKALLEIIEHYVKFKVIAENISLPDVPNEVLNGYPMIQANIQEIETAGYSLLIHDASLGGKYPVVAATLLNPNDQGISTSFGAHSKFKIALERSLTNLLQGRELSQLDGFCEAGFDKDETASAQNLEAHFMHSHKNSNAIVGWEFLSDKSNFEFVNWDSQDLDSKTSDDLKQLLNTIHNEGNDIYISDYNEIGIYTCRIIIPSMSEIYPIDDLIWENNNIGISVRDQILKPNKTIKECEQLIQDLEDLNQEDNHLISDLICMTADADNIFKDLSLVELITLLALKTQDNERIQEGCEWLSHYKKINPHRLKTYQCINTILQLDSMTNYGNALSKLYTRPILNDALALIDGEDIFPLVSEWKMHTKLIEAYEKIV